MLIDDLHWSDEESFRILLALSEHIEGSRVLILTAARPGNRDLGGHVRAIRLPALTVADTETLLVSIGTFPQLGWSHRLAHVLHGATGGSPLLTLDLLRLVGERGELVVREGTWFSPDFAILLDSIQKVSILEARIEGLDPTGRQILLLLAVAGIPLSLAAIAPDTATSTESVTQRLQELEQRGYVSRADQGWEIGHEELAATMVRISSEPELRSAHLQLGRFLADKDDGRITTARAIRHLAEAAAEEEITPLVRRWVRKARQNGDYTACEELILPLLGPGREEKVARLVKDLPFHLRYRWFPGAIAGAIVGTALLAAVVLAREARVTVPSPEAEFLLATGTADLDYRELTRISVSRAQWPDSPIRETDGIAWGRWMGMSHSFGGARVDPDGRGMAFSRIVQDSGLTDLFLQEGDGSVRRLTDAVGDDLEPSWSPDGRYLAFQTAGWTPRGDEDFDIGILEVSTRSTRQLTSGPDSDRFPRWSPDGSRIAFIRQRDLDGLTELCWVSYDTQASHCLKLLETKAASLLGWRDPGRVILQTDSDELAGALLSITLASGQIERVLPAGVGSATLSPDGAWITVEEKGSLSVFALENPQRRRRIASSGHSTGTVIWLPSPNRRRARYSLGIEPTGDGVVGVPHFMRTRSGEKALDGYPPEVLRWRVADTSVAVGMRGGSILPRREGETWVLVTAGGWRSDSVRLRVNRADSRTVFGETWHDSTLSRWLLYGDPKPVVVRAPVGGRAFFTNGDQTFVSGAVTRGEFPSTSGLGVEFALSAPISRAKWQDINVKLGSLQGLFGGAELSGCELYFPAGEGRDQTGKIGLREITIPAPAHLGDGEWHHVRIQAFPDRTCALAIDGQPVWRSRERLFDHGLFRISLSGHSVGTRILVGPVEAWEGVRTDVDWKKLER